MVDDRAAQLLLHRKDHNITFHSGLASMLTYTTARGSKGSEQATTGPLNLPDGGGQQFRAPTAGEPKFKLSAASS